jgi:hypothetical protein
MLPLVTPGPDDVRYESTRLCALHGLRPPERVIALYAHAQAWMKAWTGEEGIDDRIVRAEFVEPGMTLIYDEDRFDIPEFFKIATPGDDGIQYGFLVHAPELGSTDFPFVEHSPRCWDPVRGLGISSREGLGVLLSRSVARAADTTEASFWSALGWAPGQPQRDKSSQLALLEYLMGRLEVPFSAQDGGILVGSAPSFAPPVPEGWRFVPTFDGVGVLAPASAFDPDIEDYAALDYAEDDPDFVLPLGSKALVDGHPATALGILRNSLFRRHEASDYVRVLSDEHPKHIDAMREAYLALNRPLLAARLTGVGAEEARSRLRELGFPIEDDAVDE